MTALTTDINSTENKKVIVEEDTDRDVVSTLQLYKKILQGSFLYYVETQVNFLDSDDIVYNLSEEKMNRFAYSVSEPSLNEFWEEEDDEYWNSYLD